MKTYVAKPSTRQRDWVLVDANGKTLGRLATQVADMLRGKRKPEYTPHVDTGDFVVIVNAEKIHVTGDKRSAKMYRHHSGYPGGLRTRTLEEMLAAPARGGHPDRGEGHAAPQPAGAPAAAQAEGVRRPRASARGPAADPGRDGEGVIEREEPDQVEQPQPEVTPARRAARGGCGGRAGRGPSPRPHRRAPRPRPGAAAARRPTRRPPSRRARPAPEAASPEADAEEPAGGAGRADRGSRGRRRAERARRAEQPRTLADLAADARYFATGKRKSSVARVIIRPGSGQFNLNGRVARGLLPAAAPTRRSCASRSRSQAIGDRIDVRARIHGGGISGQADAVRHGIAKALIEADPALRPELKRRQLLTRDPREKERRKAGLKKARKRPQFSKR